MTFVGSFPEPEPLRHAIEVARHADETACVEALVADAMLSPTATGRIAALARRLVEGIREQGARAGGLDAFLHEYQLSNQEGVVLMCLAEAFLRIPDADTANKLIRDKIATADWERHLGHSESLFVNASTWALMLTGRIVELDDIARQDVRSFLRHLVTKSGEPIIRQAVSQAMRIMGRQFVVGRTIDEALERARGSGSRGYRHSYDMLGEAAHTAEDAENYFKAYTDAIAAIGAESAGRGIVEGPGVSIKLSALHPRFTYSQHPFVLDELAARVGLLARQAAAADIGLCIDSEEADRLDLTLDVIEAVSGDTQLSGWGGLGFAVQAYNKSATAVIDWLADLARRRRRRMMVRLVKGAYWDTEIKRAQESGLAGYPVFTRKVSTDVSYLACARRILAAREVFFPQFATHNAHTVAAVLEMAGSDRAFEFQRLHGMGKTLYDQIVHDEGSAVACRVYAPVGSHQNLLAYLVRRLLENGANTSFVNRIVDEDAPIDDIIADPIAESAALAVKPHPRIPLPPALFGAERKNSTGLDLHDPADLRTLNAAMAADPGPWAAAPVVGGVALSTGNDNAVFDPADHRRRVGTVVAASTDDVQRAVALAARAAPDWDSTAADQRADCLERAADLLEQSMPDLMAVCVREAGKTIDDSLAEVREAVDFCRYYAHHARGEFAAPVVMPGPTGEYNQLMLHGRGVFACVSPWNFPLAIFLGQVSAALAAGNAVVAKPAEQTPLIAARAVAILHQAGVPGDVLHLLPGDGATIGGSLVADPRISGVAFTGSVETAHLINSALASRPGAIVPLIAETGGQNAMIVDSTALPEQVVEDVLASAFRSAGQRCSALRVLFVQQDISARLIRMLVGAMAELRVGDPALLSTDVGPVIDREALGMLQNHVRRMEREGRLLYEVELPDACAHGTFFAPRAYEIDRLGLLEREVFGPILHVITYAADRLDKVMDSINGLGYGLTLGVHSRLDSTIGRIHQRLRVGNTYVNRNIIGAVVGVQPFGGEGLSGTGPKAGGPRYLHRFATERTLSVNTVAAGGNPALMSLEEE